MSRPAGLGRGLNALIPGSTTGRSGLVVLPLSTIVPNSRQPRAAFDQEQLEELARSLQQMGVLQPILVRERGPERYEIIAGERRFRAARLAGLTEIPAIIRQTEDVHLLTEALVENLHRADLNPLEEAAAFRQLLDDFGMTHEELAERLGKSRSAISNTLRLLVLPPRLQQKVAEGALSAGHARALLAVESADDQERLAGRALAEGLSVRATEELVRSFLEAQETPPERQQADLARRAQERVRGPLGHLQRRLADALATRVQVRGTAERGRVVIDYAGRDDLERILGILGRGSGHDLLREDR